MEKLFSDSEVMLNVRPTKITKQQEEDYYADVSQEIIDNGWSNSPIEKIIEDLDNISSSDSGYEIAKKLEGYGSKASYNINTNFIEFLDDFDSNKDDILRKNIKDWAKTHNPKPNLEKGQKLTIETPLFRGQKKGDTLYVTGNNKESASYYIHENPNNNGGYVVAYERVESNCIKFEEHENKN